MKNSFTTNVGVLLVSIMTVTMLSGCSAPDEHLTTGSFSDNNWEMQEDGSYLVTNGDKTFTYYLDKDDKNDNYYTGNYNINIDGAAVSYIKYDLEEYGITEEYLEELVSENEDYNIEDCVCFVLECDEYIVDGENTLSDTEIIPFYGFYVVDGKTAVIEMVNMETGESCTFEMVK